MPGQNKSLDEMPEAFCGTWDVVSFTTPDGLSGKGSSGDRWRIRSGAIVCGRSDELIIKAIHSEIEADQNVHRVTFKNNAVQFAFLRSDAKPGVVLVIQFLNGREMLRCLLEKR